MKIFNNSISTTFPLSILSTHHYDLSTVDMFGFDTKQKIREPSFQPQLPEIPLFQPFPHIIYLSLTSRLPSQHVSSLESEHMDSASLEAWEHKTAGEWFSLLFLRSGLKFLPSTLFLNPVL